LSGYVSSPWGFPQSWGVAPSTAPNPAILSKFNINNALQWKSFTYMVAQDAMNENRNFKGYSVNGGGNQLIMPDSDTVSDLSNYFPSSNVEFEQTMPIIAYYDNSSVMVFPDIQKNPAYWLFGVSMYSAGRAADIDYENLGYSAVCPAGGIQPGAPPSWTFMMGNLRGFNTNSFVAYQDPSFSYLSQNLYLCIPTAKSIININETVFTDDDYSGVGNYITNQINYVSQSSINGTDNSYDTNIAGQVVPQTGQVYYINDGTAKYTFVIAEGFFNMLPLWAGYYEGAVLWEGEPASYNDLYIESSASPNGGGGVPSPAPVWPVTDISGSPVTINF
jgi:hypothetical protein